MSKNRSNISHEEIAQKFVDSGAFDFNKIGKIISELGPTLAVRDNGLHGVVIGGPSVIACMMPVWDATNFLSNLQGSGLAGTIAEDVARSG